MGEQLKPCPFCGAQAELRQYDCEFFCQCIECFGSTSADHQTEDEALTAWNRRAEILAATPAEAGREAIKEFQALGFDFGPAKPDEMNKPQEIERLVSQINAMHQQENSAAEAGREDKDHAK